jgi:hypothetical protein
MASDIETLARRANFDIKGARNEGYSDEEIMSHLRGQVAEKTGIEQLASMVRAATPSREELGAFTPSNVKGALSDIAGTSGRPGRTPLTGDKGTKTPLGVVLKPEGAAETAASMGVQIPAVYAAGRMGGAAVPIAARTGAAISRILASSGIGAASDEDPSAGAARGAVSGAIGEVVPAAAKIAPWALSKYRAVRGIVQNLQRLGEGKGAEQSAQLTQLGAPKVTGGGSYFDTNTGRSVEIPVKVGDVQFKSTRTGLPTPPVKPMLQGEAVNVLYHEHARDIPQPSALRAFLDRWGPVGRAASDVSAGQVTERMARPDQPREEERQESEPEPMSGQQVWKATKFGKGMQDPNFDQFRADMQSKGVADQDIVAMWHQLRYGGPTNARVK